MRILIIRQDHLGDLVLTTPLFRALSRAGHDVHVVARRSALAVLAGNPFIASVTGLEEIAPQFPRGILSLAGWIRRMAPDVVMLPHAKPLALVLGARMGHLGRILTMWGGVSARALGCECLRSALPHHPRHISEIWMDLAQRIGARSDGFAPDVFVEPAEAEALQARLPGPIYARWVVVHPGCAGNTCNLPPEVYAEIVAHLHRDTGCFIAITGSAVEAGRFKGVFPSADNGRIWNAMGQLDLRQLCALLARADCLVSVGTGPLHIASAVGTATVSPFCRRVGVSAKVWGNLGAPAQVLEPPDGFCEEQSAGEHCNFCGTISAETLARSVIEILSPWRTDNMDI